jgi:HK97 gp10 family phage protein
MTQSFTLLGFIAHLENVEHNMHAIGPGIIRKACEMIAAQARAAIGHEHEMWPALAPSTIEDRVKKGFAANEPLLRTGALRDSIQWTTSASGMEGAVGSNSPIAVYQELGTSRIPPRSFLVSSVISMESKIQHMAARAVVAVLAGRGLHSSELSELLELLHMLKDAAEYAKEQLVDPIFENQNEENR